MGPEALGLEEKNLDLKRPCLLRRSPCWRVEYPLKKAERLRQPPIFQWHLARLQYDHQRFSLPKLLRRGSARILRLLGSSGLEAGPLPQDQPWGSCRTDPELYLRLRVPAQPVRPTLRLWHLPRSWGRQRERQGQTGKPLWMRSVAYTVQDLSAQHSQCRGHLGSKSQKQWPQSCTDQRWAAPLARPPERRQICRQLARPRHHLRCLPRHLRSPGLRNRHPTH